MTEPTQSPSDEPVVTPETGAGPTDPSTLSDLGYPGLGYGDVEPPENQLQTFDEMLPAARAFFRRS